MVLVLVGSGDASDSRVVYPYSCHDALTGYERYGETKI